MTDRDEVAELADRIVAKMRRGEEWESEFEIDYASHTDEERDDFLALMDQRAAQGRERLEALEEENRILKLLLLHKWGMIDALEFVRRVARAVPDPLAEPKSD